MKNIIIFGDSYGDPECITDDLTFIDTNTWYNMLKSNYNVINHCVSGAGPHYSFKQYYDFISKNKILDDYICIFLLSGQDRIQFFGRPPNHGTHISWSNTDQKSYLINDRDKSFYENFNSEIDFLYLSMQEEIEWFNSKNISFLYANSILLGLKTIIFVTSSSYVINAKNYRLIKYEKLNNSNFFIYPTILSNISEMEFDDIDKLRNEPSRIHFSYKDYRRNHFSPENHVVFYENIEKIIDNDYPLTLFKKYLNSIDYYGEVVFDEHIEKDKFIYD